MPLPRGIYSQIAILAGSIGGVIILLVALSTPIMGMFAIGPIVSPGGIFGAGYGATVSGTVRIAGITDEVTIIRDSWGIPHIYAENQEDVAFGLGYCHAQDRLFQMEMTIRTGMGRMSEIMGEDSLEDDLWYQTIGIERAAQEMIDTYEVERVTNTGLDEMLEALDAYCLGVNAVIEQKIRTKTLPIEFKLLNFEPEPWSPLKVFVYNRLMSLMLTYSTYDLRASLLLEEMFDGNETAMNELFPVNNTYYQVPVIPAYGDYPPPPATAEITAKKDIKRSDKELESLVTAINDVLDNTPESVSYFQQAWIGSNNWVAGGNKTETGLPILCNDMHLSISLPHIWYEAHLVVTNGDLNIFGYTLTGTPVVIVGFNTHIAWGMTNVGNDATDWYEYIWNADKSQYWNGTHWKSPEEVTVKIPVKGQPDREEVIRFTDDGVIMTENVGGTSKILAVKWTATEKPTYEILAMHGANRATNWAEFNESMQYFKDPTQNLVFADDSGNIALRPTGRFIKRNYFGEGRFIQNGSDPLLDKTWEYIPYNELPLSVNPPQGYLASANQKSTGPDYPYYISSTQDEGYRGRSINRLLKETDNITVEDMMDFQAGDGGVFDTRAEAFTPFIVDAVERSGEATEIYATALDALDGWQDSPDKYQMKKDFIGPTIFTETMNWFKQYVFEDEWTEAGIPGATKPQDNILEYLVREVPDSKWFDNVSTTGVEDRDDILVKAFFKAVDELVEDFGSNILKWKWGEYHQMDYRHLTGIPAFGRGRFPHDGSGDTLLAAGGRLVRGGPSERMVVDFSGDKSNSWSVLPTGASGIPTSPHYDDQIDLWLNGEYHPMLVTYDTVEAFPEEYLEATLILKPV